MKNLIFILSMLICFSFVASAFSSASKISSDSENPEIKFVSATSEIQKLDGGLQILEFSGNDLFDDFLANGGAKSDKDVVTFLKGKLLSQSENSYDFSFEAKGFGCSAFQVKNSAENGFYFGRNFDWNRCNALILVSKPTSGYKSISTVNLDFISMAGLAFSMLPDRVKGLICNYAPLDGMNEKGLTVAVNMIQDSDAPNQNTNLPDITTTSAVRLLLNKAATVEEALELLKKYDFHASMGFCVHFALSDANGKMVAVEFINNKMSVIETDVLTNFYVTPGKKYGIGTAQSHTRFEILQKTLKNQAQMNSDEVRLALSSVSKKNFGEFESTEWSVVFDQNDLSAIYFHREDYSEGWKIKF